MLRFAERGKRLFTAEDARLADRIVEQLRRAVAHDRAIEQGRSEERGRIAQDLHDDIGARLLTLMYKAPNTEMEDYVRHTLQDLKTLTRGLAATTHFLSHAAAEWKADIAQRLAPTGCTLEWSFTQDVDIQLNVVQWSGLTRILRELVSNIIAHAQGHARHDPRRPRRRPAEADRHRQRRRRHAQGLVDRPRPGRHPQARAHAGRHDRLAAEHARGRALRRQRAAGDSGDAADARTSPGAVAG